MKASKLYFRGAALACASLTLSCTTAFDDVGDPTPSDQEFRTIIEIVADDRDCTSFDAALNAAFAAANPGDTIYIPSSGGPYWTCEVHYPPSSVTIEGDASSGTVKDNPTLIVQQDAAEGIFHMVGVTGVTIEDLYLAAHATVRSGNYASAVIGIYNASSITIQRNHIVSGFYGVYVSDQNDLEVLVNDPVICADEGSKNSDIVVQDNVFTNTDQYALRIDNVDEGLFQRNFLTWGSTTPDDGFKLTCGPVTDSEFRDNYMTGHNYDGLDVAWTVGAEYDDKADGLFYNNVLTSNLSYQNGSNGLAIKSAVTNSIYRYCPQDVDNDFDALAQVGTYSMDHNLSFSNGGGEYAIEKSNPWNYDCVGAGAPADTNKTQFDHNIAWRDPLATVPNSPNNDSAGLALHQSFNVYVYSNWFGEHADPTAMANSCALTGDPSCEIGASGGYVVDAALGTPVDRGHTFDANYLDEDGTNWDSAVEALTFSNSSAPTLTNLLSSIDGWVMIDGSFHCEDTDGDDCPNGCEAIFGTDPLDNSSTPTLSGGDCVATIDGTTVTCGGGTADLCGGAL